MSEKTEAMEKVAKKVVDIQVSSLYSYPRLISLEAMAIAALALPPDDWLDPEEPPKKTCEISMEITKGKDIKVVSGLYGKYMGFRYINLQHIQNNGWVLTGYQYLPEPRERKEKDDE